jgi:hypothetical protein
MVADVDEAVVEYLAVPLTLGSSVRCFCGRASSGQCAVNKSHRKCFVAGCRIGATPFVVGVR